MCIRDRTVVVVDAADADDGVVDLELLDEIHRRLADDTAVAAHRTAGHQYLEVGLGAELRGDVQVVGDDLQALVILQLTGDGLGGGTDIDEQLGVIGNLRGHRLGDALFLLAHLPGAHAIGGVMNAR